MSRTILSNIRVQMTSAWSSSNSSATSAGAAGSGTKHKTDRLLVEDKKKWPSEHDFGQEKPKYDYIYYFSTNSNSFFSRSNKNNSDSSNLAVPKLSVCADAQKVDRNKLLQTEFPIIEFDADTFQVLLDYLHSGCCPLSCITIPGQKSSLIDYFRKYFI